MAFNIGNFVQSASKSVTDYASSTAKNMMNQAYGSAVDAINRSMGIGGSGASSALIADATATAEIQQVYKPNETHHRVTIYSSDDDSNNQPLSVTGWYGAETISFSFGGSYDAPFAQGLLNMMGGPQLETIARLYGVQSVTKDLTAQMWQGGTRIALDIPLVIYAEYNGETEILDVIRKLGRMALPSTTESGFLRAPGPRPNLNKAIDNLGSAYSNLVSGFSAFGDVVSNAAADSQSLTQVISGGPNSVMGALTSVIAAPVSSPDGNIGVRIGNLLHLDSVVVESVNPNIEWQFDVNGKPLFATIHVHVSTFKIPTAEDMESILCMKRQPTNTDPANSESPGSLMNFGGNISNFIGGG